MVKTSRSKLLTGRVPLQKLSAMNFHLSTDQAQDTVQTRVSVVLTIASHLIMSRGSCSRRASIVIKQSQVYHFFFITVTCFPSLNKGVTLPYLTLPVCWFFFCGAGSGGGGGGVDSTVHVLYLSHLGIDDSVM